MNSTAIFIVLNLIALALTAGCLNIVIKEINERKIKNSSSQKFKTKVNNFSLKSNNINTTTQNNLVELKKIQENVNKIKKDLPDSTFNNEVIIELNDSLIKLEKQLHDNSKLLKKSHPIQSARLKRSSTRLIRFRK